MFDENWFPRSSQQIINALRFGGYASFIPCVIQSAWDSEAAPLAGFPVSICFTGLQLPDDQAAGSYVVSSYWFDPQSYVENTGYQMLAYYSRYLKNRYHVAIRRSKVNGIWEGCKMRGDEIVVTASDPDFTRFVTKLTMGGLDDGEHVEPMLTRIQTASTGIWLYEPEKSQNKTPEMPNEQPTPHKFYREVTPMDLAMYEETKQRHPTLTLNKFLEMLEAFGG